MSAQLTHPRFKRIFSCTRARTRALLLCFLGSIIFGICAIDSARANDSRVVIVSMGEDKASNRFIRGVKSQFKQSGSQVDVTVVISAGIADPETALPDSLRKLQPSVIITIGERLTRVVSQSITDIPIIFGGIFNPHLGGFVQSLESPGGNLTGVSLDISPLTQFNYFKQVFPGLKKLGVIYSAETAKLIPHARVVARSKGIELLAIEVGKKGKGYERDTYKALDSLLPIIDGLWSLADGSVFSSVGKKLIVKKTLLKRVPFMGYSSSIVASGALFALDIDQKDIGRQAAELTLRAISGEAVSKIPVIEPRIIWFHYNENTASRVNIDIPDELQVVAKEVHR